MSRLSAKLYGDAPAINLERQREVMASVRMHSCNLKETQRGISHAFAQIRT